MTDGAQLGVARRHPAGPGSRKVLFIHGFTGGPATLEPQIDGAVRAGFDVYAPLLSGHGTSVEEMLETRYDDYIRDVRRALDLLDEDSQGVSVVGISMGGTLAVDLALSDSRVQSMVLVNPLVLPPAESYFSLLDQLIEAGMEIAPAVGSDIADPDVKEASYDGSPIRAAKSLFENVARISPQVGGLEIPILLYNSLQDHVVPVESGVYLAETAPKVTRIELERSFHVATLDFDRNTITDGMLEFLRP